jgi:hypothetical protein
MNYNKCKEKFRLYYSEQQGALHRDPDTMKIDTSYGWHLLFESINTEQCILFGALFEIVWDGVEDKPPTLEFMLQMKEIFQIFQEHYTGRRAV